MKLLSILILISTSLYQFIHGQAPLEWISEEMEFGLDFDGNLNSFDWYECPYGYVIGGFYKSDGDSLSSLDLIKCIRPNTDNIIPQMCQHENIESSFNDLGSVRCPDLYFVNGIYVNRDVSCGLHCMEWLNCCQYDSNVISVGETEYGDDNNWDTCFNGNDVWCIVPTNRYINGFDRGGTDQSVHRLEHAYTHELFLIMETPTDHSSLPAGKVYMFMFTHVLLRVYPIFYIF